ncbi:MAG: hypothetical protein GXY33_03650 [Phycisphaerae bacterium]|nr:hypothetical protein [Phycisphaerae bacterium]
MKNLAVAMLAVLLGLSQAAAVSTSFFEDTEAADFKKGQYEDVLISNAGYIALGLTSEVLLGDRADVSAVYAIDQLSDGAVVAGTGPDGKVFKHVDGAWQELFKADQPYVVSMAVGASDKLYVGTAGDQGLIYEIAPDGQSKRIFQREGVNYIWALLLVDGGRLLAATGPNGQVFQIDESGASEVFSCEQKNIIAMTGGREGMVYLGTDTDGILYVLEPDGGKYRSRALYDAQEDQISALTADPDGIVYFATASGKAAPGEARAFLERAPGSPATQPSGASGSGAENSGNANQTTMAAPSRSASSSPAMGRVPSGNGKQNAVYRLDRLGFVNEVYRDQLDFNDLLFHDGALYAGTWPDGWVFEILPEREEVRTAAKAEAKFVYDLAPGRNDALLVATGSPGGVIRLGPGLAGTGTFTSQVFDAEQIAGWGNIFGEFADACAPDVCPQVQTRSSAIQDDDDPAWSAWSEPRSLCEPQRILSPSGRFIQYKITFAPKGDATARLSAVKIAYLVPNQPPLIESLQVLRPGERPGGNKMNSVPPPPQPQPNGPAPKLRQYKLMWKASDANGDTLTYDLYARLAGAPYWFRIDQDLQPTNYQWDPTAAPDGEYIFKVVASDRQDNPPDMAMESARVSDPVLVDNTAPRVVGLETERLETGDLLVKANLVDELSLIEKAYIRINAQDEWLYLAPADGIYDSRSEYVETIVPVPDEGPVLISIKVDDDSGNTGFGQMIVPEAVPVPAQTAAEASEQT